MTPSEEAMDAILQCGICRSEFADPRQLTCGHVFCFKCIDADYKIRDRNNGKCPLCRADYWPRPHRDTDSLPQCALPLRHILSLRERREQYCEYAKCKPDAAPFICVKCRLWLCDNCASKTCTKNRNQLGIHEAFQPHELESSLFDIVKRSRHNSCREHPRLDVLWYCNDCKALACNLCKINLHEGHGSLVTIDAKAHGCRVDLKKTITSLKEKQNEHRKNKETLTELINSCCKEFVNVNHCYTSLDHCNIGLEECENIVLLISKLLENGSMKVIIETSLNLEERIQTELGKSLLLEKVREVFVTTSEEIEQETDDVKKGEENETHVNDNACENEDPSVGLCGDSCESSLCTSDGSALWICLRCRKWLCGSCKVASCVPGRLGNKTHTALNAADVDPALYDILSRSRRTSCPTNPDNDVESYCSQCHVIACMSCRHRHEHHGVVIISTKARSCRTNMKEKKKQLRNKIAEYSITKFQVSKIISGCHFDVLNSTYFEKITSECVLRINKCDDLDKVLHFLLRYASDRVIIETLDTIESEIEEELQKNPSDNLSELCHVVNYVSDTLNQTAGDEKTAVGKQLTSQRCPDESGVCVGTGQKTW